MLNFKLIFLFQMIIFLRVVSPNLANAQEEPQQRPFIHLIENPYQLNLLENVDENEHAFVCIPKQEMPQRLRLLVLKNAKEGAFYIELVDPQNFLNGTVVRYNKLNYGGYVNVGDYLKINGSFDFQRSIKTINIDNNLEFTLYKINLRDLTIEPTYHQYMKFYRPPSHLDVKQQAGNFLLAPSSLGFFIRKKDRSDQGFRVGFSYGPVIDNLKRTNIYSFFNFRVAIPLSRR